MTDLILWVAGFCTGAAFTGCLAGWFSFRMGPPRGSYGPRQPEQPLAADVIRYARWRDEQIERALRDEPIRLDEGRVQRGNGSGGPTTPKPQFPSPRVIREDLLP